MKYFILLLIISLPLKMPQSSPSSDFRKGKRLAEKDPETAYQLLSKAIKYSDASWKKRDECFSQRGMIAYNAKKTDAALNDFVAAVKLNDSNVVANKYIAKILFDMQKLNEATGFLDKLEVLDPGDEELYYLRGRIFLQLFLSGQNMMQANILYSSIEQFKKAIQLNKKYYEAYYYRAQAHVVGNLIDEAINDLNLTLKYKKDFYRAWFQLARLHLTQNFHMKSIEELENCLSFQEDFVPALVLLLQLCHEHRFSEKVQTYLKIALKHYPLDPGFRSLNQLYQSVPEETLPTIPKETTPSPPTFNPLPKKESDEPKSTWLEVTEDNKTATTQEQTVIVNEKPLNIQFNSENKKQSSKPKEKVFPKTSWY